LISSNNVLLSNIGSWIIGKSDVDILITNTMAAKLITSNTTNTTDIINFNLYIFLTFLLTETKQE
uniref:hypothetical protein n=1 Tax=Liquorilactobacillus sicerae TaxID=1416943 RepID=UPI0024815CFA